MRDWLAAGAPASLRSGSPRSPERPPFVIVRAATYLIRKTLGCSHWRKMESSRRVRSASVIGVSGVERARGAARTLTSAAASGRTDGCELQHVARARTGVGVEHALLALDCDTLAVRAVNGFVHSAVATLANAALQLEAGVQLYGDQENRRVREISGT